jgi:hypothetical protein
MELYHTFSSLQEASSIRGTDCAKNGLSALESRENIVPSSPYPPECK